MRRRGRRNPATTEEAALGLPGVAGVVDSGRPESGWALRTAGDMRPDGTIVAWHVTDDPRRVAAMLRRGASLRKAYGPRGARCELGPGLYVSGAPQVWTCRSRGKWAFLQQLLPDDLGALRARLAIEVQRMRETRYISASEEEYGLRILREASPALWADLAGQPYNLEWWRADWLKRHLGHDAQCREPAAVEVHLAGRFAMVDAGVPRASLRALRRMGFSGAFTTGGMASMPELVVWDNAAIVAFGTERRRSRP